MLYSIFIYQRRTGIPLWEKSFDRKFTPEKLQLFSSFFGAIQSFTAEMVKKSQTISRMEMGQFILDLIQSPDSSIDIVTLSDLSDSKIVKRFQIELLKLASKHHAEFQKFDGNLQIFEFLDQEVALIMDKIPELRGSGSLLDKPIEILSAIWNTVEKLSPEERQSLETQRTELNAALKLSPDLVKKIDILRTLESVSLKLQDKLELEKLQPILKKLVKELVTVKEHLMIYLDRTKKSLQNALQDGTRKFLADMDFKEVYLNLFSFATKLKILGHKELSEEYLKIAGWFLVKSPELDSHFAEMTKKILRLSEDVCDYLPRPYCDTKIN